MYLSKLWEKLGVGRTTPEHKELQRAAEPARLLKDAMTKLDAQKIIHEAKLRHQRKQLQSAKGEQIKALKAKQAEEIRKWYEKLAEAEDDRWYGWDEVNLFKTGVKDVLVLFKSGYVHRMQVHVVNKTGGSMFGGDFYQLKTLHGDSMRATPIAWRKFIYKEVAE